ncbi:MAG: tagaturonate epimerase family protein [bacterium]
MSIQDILPQPNPNQSTTPAELSLTSQIQLTVYPKSVQGVDNTFIFVGKNGSEKFLCILTEEKETEVSRLFEGILFTYSGGNKSATVKLCPMHHRNADSLRMLFPFTCPTVLGLHNSLGCGDRLGIANAGHLRAMTGSGFKPILAQQSVRELERTKREAGDVMDAATWAVFQEGYKDGFGADGDHLKTSADIDRYASVGFTMFTLDIGAHVVNEAARMPLEEVKQRAAALPWNLLQDSLESMVDRYAGQQFTFADDFVLVPETDLVLRALVKYGAAIAQTVVLANHLKQKWGSKPYEIELSVDETDTPTSPLEHFIIANECKRLHITLVSLAPRFIGDFEKGIEYKGDLCEFTKEYRKHLLIAQYSGPYKISIHSGSDKFLVYEAVGSLKSGAVHVKTAGTSWLEALRAIAIAEPQLFREILDYARAHYQNDRQSYHVTAEIAKMKRACEYTDAELQSLLMEENARQILHVTFGTILSSKDEHGRLIFQDRLMECLKKNEEVHYQCLIKHFERHLKPLRQLNS